MRILADATLPMLSALFASDFKVSTYRTPAQLASMLHKHDILLCRSTLKVTAQLLKNTPIQCIATASSGVDHIDSNYLKQHGIGLLDAKGCNAVAVADYVMATLALLQHQKQLMGNKAGVIGAGQTGSRVAKRLIAAGYEVVCFDPLKALDSPDAGYCDWEVLLNCDVLCVHANFHTTPPYASNNLFDNTVLNQLKPGTSIINTSRGGIINQKALLNTPQKLIYCTDVYCNEPAIDPQVVTFATLCTPHIAGHSIEAKTAAVTQLSQKLHAYYGVTAPRALQTKQIVLPPLLPKLHWQDSILDIYNPLVETQALKKAADKQYAFITQRQLHQARHDFSVYDASQLDHLTRSLLGYLHVT